MVVTLAVLVEMVFLVALARLPAYRASCSVEVVRPARTHQVLTRLTQAIGGEIRGGRGDPVHEVPVRAGAPWSRTSPFRKFLGREWAEAVDTAGLHCCGRKQ